MSSSIVHVFFEKTACINKEVLKSAIKISDQLFACTSRTVGMPNFDLCPNFGVVNKH